MSAFYKTLAALLITFALSFIMGAFCGLPKEEAKDMARFNAIVLGLCIVVQRQSKK